jgi:hypothetical protein
MSYQNPNEPTTRSWPPWRERLPLPGRGKLAWRVIWVTIAFYAVAVPASESIRSGVKPDVRTMAFAIGVFLLNYLYLFVLIYGYVPYNNDDVLRGNWRAWTAWLFITGFIVWYLVRYGMGLDPWRGAY